MELSSLSLSWSAGSDEDVLGHMLSVTAVITPKSSPDDVEGALQPAGRHPYASLNTSQLVQCDSPQQLSPGLHILASCDGPTSSTPQQSPVMPGDQHLALHANLAVPTASMPQPPVTHMLTGDQAFSTSLNPTPFPGIQALINSHLAAQRLPSPGSLLPGQTHMFNSLQAPIPDSPISGYSRVFSTTAGDRPLTHAMPIPHNRTGIDLRLSGTQCTDLFAPTLVGSSDHDALEALFNLPWSSAAPYTIARPVAHLTEEDLLLKRWVESTMPSFSETSPVQRASAPCEIDFGRTGRRMSFSYTQHGRLSNDTNKRRQVQTMDLTMLSEWRELPPAPICNDHFASTSTVCPALIAEQPLSISCCFIVATQQARVPDNAVDEAAQLTATGQPLSSGSLDWQGIRGDFQQHSDVGRHSSEGSFLLRTWPCPTMPQRFSARNDLKMGRSLDAPIPMTLENSLISLPAAVATRSRLTSTISQVGSSAIPTTSLTDLPRSSSLGKAAPSAVEAPASTSTKVGKSSIQQLRKLFHLPILKAAENLKLSLSTLKKWARDAGVHRWPQRKVTSLQALHQEVLDDLTLDASTRRALVSDISDNLEAIMQDPNTGVNPSIEEVLQARHKARYEIGRSMARGISR